MSEPPERGPEGPATIPERVDHVLSAMFHEPMMRPLWIVVLAHAAAFLIPVLLLALRDRWLPALAALAILLVASGAAVAHDLRARRLRVLTGSVLVAWALAGIGAVLGDRHGLF